MAKELTYRFLPEYANEKKARIKRQSAYYADNCLSADGRHITFDSKKAIKKIDDVLQYAKRGLYTLDEAMKEIASVDLWDYVITK